PALDSSLATTSSGFLCRSYRPLRPRPSFPTRRSSDLASGSLPVATLADPATLRPGHLVLALARLDEGGPRAAFGAVSATCRRWRCWKGGEIDSWLQSDVDIYPGFGGGPLVDATGRIHARY